MRIVKIAQLSPKLGAFENGKKIQKITDFSQTHEIPQILVIFRHFQIHLNLSQVDRFERFSSQIKALFFNLNHFFCGIWFDRFNSLLLVNH